MRIENNLSDLNDTELKIYKKFKRLSSNQEPSLQGDGEIKITPFDDYVSFIIYDEIDGEDVPLDLSNVGTLFLSFIGNKDSVRIPNFTDISDIDISDGEVLFKITKQESERILNIENRNFYISSKHINENGESDETFIYNGIFSTQSESSKRNITKELENLRLEYTKELSKLKDENNRLKKEIDRLNEKLEESNSIISKLNENNKKLTEFSTVSVQDLTEDQLLSIEGSRESQGLAQEFLKENLNRTRDENIEEVNPEESLNSFYDVNIKNLQKNTINR